MILKTISSDVISVLSCGSIIQHGHFNDRIYLMKIGENSTPQLSEELIKMAISSGYSKIFVKIPKSKSVHFIESGFKEEAVIPKLYKGLESGIFLSYYLNKEREKEPQLEIINRNLQIAKNKIQISTLEIDSSKFTIRQCDKNDVIKMAELYKKVFASYPFPIFDPTYLLDTMQQNIDYYGVVYKDNLIALSSAELDVKNQNVEMTDFATLEQWLGNNLSLYLLNTMEHEVIKKKITTSFTIARALSPSMNITFAKLGYEYGGRLINNTNIFGNIESMNVWFKSLV